MNQKMEDEHEVWTPHPSLPAIEDPMEAHPHAVPTATSHAVSCFNEFAKLCESPLIFTCRVQRGNKQLADLCLFRGVRFFF